MLYNKSRIIQNMAAWYKRKDYFIEGISFAGENVLEHQEVLNEDSNLPYAIEVVSENLFVPWALDIASDGRIFFNERNGNVRLIENGILDISPVYTFLPPFEAQGEGGLLGLVLDSDFDHNGYFYVMYTYLENNQFFNRIVRMHYEKGNTIEDKVLLDKIPGDRVHNGGRLKIGPDGKLYATTGDTGKPELSQDINNLAGKILRLEVDGSVPSDNPFPNSYVYAYGIRNAQGLDWNRNNVLYASGHGDVGDDEINIIVPGGNYGWPLKQGDFIKPVYNSGMDSIAPSGIAFAKSGPFEGKLLVTTLRGTELLVLTFNESGDQVLQTDSYLKNEYGRLREVHSAPDGSIYLGTSNLDGRGLPKPGDDKIFRLVPVLQEN